MINSLRSTYFDYTSGIDQSFKLNQKSELPPFYGNCIYEIRSINNWSGNLESDKYFRFKSVNSSDYKCLGRIIGSSEIQGKALLEIEKKYIDIYVAKNLQVEYFYKFLSLFLISLISKKLNFNSKIFVFFAVIFISSYQYSFEPQFYNYEIFKSIPLYVFNSYDLLSLLFVFLIISYEKNFFNFSNVNIQNSTLEYRPEIDFLRALSVAAVVLYHTEFFNLKGGYLGVDVFFVISGYLISYKILVSIHKNEFSFKRFYVNRIKRILPASLMTLVMFFPVAYFLLTPIKMSNYLQSVLSSNFFFSNYYFLNSGDYNSDPSKITPFINMWSLSVEEQYYLIFPLICLIIFKTFKNYSKLLFNLLILFSFYFAFSSVFVDQAKYFYMLQYRIWEFLIGSIVAFIFLKNTKQRVNKILNYTIETISLVVIVISFLIFDDLLLNLFYPNF